VEYRKAAVGPEADAATAIGAWLVQKGYATAYQIKVLLAGKPGPFVYGPYRVTDRFKEPPFHYGYVALHAESQFPVWLEFFSSRVVEDPNLLAAAEASAIRLCALDHPSLHRWYEYRVDGTYRYVVMERLNGQLLAKVLGQNKKIGVRRVCWIGQQLAQALLALHQAGMVHGHLRPDQIWVDKVGHVWLLLHLLVPGFGSPPPAEDIQADYWAPEYTQPGFVPYPLSDIYALGCLMYRLLSGNTPFPGGTVAEKLHRHATEPIRPLESLGVPAALSRMITYLLAKNPSVRTADLQQVAKAFAEWSEGEADRVPPVQEPTGKSAFLQSLLVQRQAILAGPTAPLVAVSNPLAVTSARTGGPAVAGAPRAAALPVATAMPAASTVPAGTPTLPMAVPTTAAANPAVPFTTVPTGAMPAAVVPTGGVATAIPSTAVAATAVSAMTIPATTVPTAPLMTSVGAGTGPTVATVPGGVHSPIAAQPVMPGHPMAVQGPQVFAVPPAAPAVHVAPVPRRRRSRGWQTWLFTATILCLAVAVVYFGQQYLNRPSGSQQSQELTSTETADSAAATSSNSSSDTSSSNNMTKGGAPSQTGSSTGSSVGPQGDASAQSASEYLWESPTQGNPLSLEFVPPEPLLVLFLAPRQIAQSAEAGRVIKALGPEIEELIGRWPEQQAGLKWDEVERLVLSVHEDTSGTFRTAFVVYPAKEQAPDALRTAWGMPEDKGNYFQGQQWAYYMKREESPVKRFLMGDPKDVQEVAQRDGAAPFFYNGVEPLLRYGDDSRMATLLFVPHHLRTKLLTDTANYYFGSAGKLRRAVDSILGDRVTVAALSLHVTEQISYLEFTAVTPPTDDKRAVLESLKGNIASWPKQLEEYVATLSQFPYWTRYNMRFLGMLDYLNKQIRGQVDNNIIVLNAALPSVALHNLAFGVDMLLVGNPGALPSPTPVPMATASATSPKSLEQLLQQKITMRFEVTSLEFAMRDLATLVKESYPGLPFEFDIVLLGMDMQKDGITKNQSIRDFNKQDATVADVLTALVMRGNPNTTVKSPNEPNQKLVWCVGDDPNQPGRRVILITTRDGAATRGLTLPEVFTKAP